MLPWIAVSPQDCIVLQNVKGKLSLELGYTREKMQIGFWHWNAWNPSQERFAFSKDIWKWIEIAEMPTSGNRRTGHRNLENWKKNKRPQPKTSCGSALGGIMLLSRTRITVPAPQPSLWVREEGYCPLCLFMKIKRTMKGSVLVFWD